MAYIRCSGNIGGSLKVRTASGNPCTFTTDLADALVSLTAEIVASGGGGTPSTPIPLVGHSELNLTRCGKNLFDKTTIIGGFWIKPDGTTEYSPDRMYSDLIRIKPNTQYYITNTIGGNDFFSTIHYDSNLNIIGAKNVGGSGDVAGTITSYNDSAYMRINSFLADLDTLMVSEGNTATAYAPYNGQTFTVAFGQTVYGGVYDANAGKVTLTHALLDNSRITEVQPTSGIEYRFNFNVIPDGMLGTQPVICSVFDGSAPYSIYYPFKMTMAQGRHIYFTAENMTTTELLNLCQSNAFQLVYPLATPIVIDVQAISPSAVVGTNNIISDGGGDVNVSYLELIRGT